MGLLCGGTVGFDVDENALSDSGLTILMLLDGMKTEIAKPAVSGNGS
jgi:hypothetical protein